MSSDEHADAKKAFAEGQELEFRVKPGVVRYGSKNDWFPCRSPDWHPNFEYRVKENHDEKTTREV
jgi:hypothetical protein